MTRHQDRQRGEKGDLPHREIGEGQVVRLVGHSGENALVGPQQIDGGQEHSEGGDHRESGECHITPDQHEELSDEPIQPGQADRGEGHEQEEPREQGHHLLQAPEVGDRLGVAPLVDHPNQ